VSHMLDRLRKMPLKARRQTPGLAPDRADIIVAGIAVVDGLMRRFKVNLLQVHSRGVRDGLLLTMIDNQQGAEITDGVDRDAGIDRFAAACTSEHELAHAKQVARLAGKLFEQLADRLKLNPADRPFLEAAARLQDVGYLINYDQHHKHSYHLILNSRLPGFRPRELELIANIARYHRGARPKAKHANFRQLTPDDQRRVEQLAAILRVAGGLDRSHSQQVRDVEVWADAPSDTTSNGKAHGENNKTVKVLVHADFNPEVDIWGARRRTKFFQKVFGRKIDVRWAKENGEADEQNAEEAAPSEAGSSNETVGADSSNRASQAHAANGSTSKRRRAVKRPKR
jgi:exopolyphosphatase / guanosine-5'-triphosphate,3'-diphosphate pyrophosphatase